MKISQQVVNDVTRLNPVPVWAIARPESVEEVQAAVRRTNGPVSVGGGHFSMGGQTASPDSLHLDMRKLNRVLDFSPERRVIRVQAGIRWCDIQRFIDPHGLSIRIMQTYANFTVGGSLSVNVHGRYVGQGPLILSVRNLSLVLADGTLLIASRDENPEVFFGAIGGYGALGVIVEAELDLVENTRVQRVAGKLPLARYVDHFRESVRSNSEAVFHNADMYAPSYRQVRSVTWIRTKKPATVPHRLKPLRRIYALEKYFLWAVSETPFGKRLREFVLDPLIYLSSAVHWRNFEAGYDVAELEPVSRTWRTYVLQEYFVPIERFAEFVPAMTEILQRHRVNVLNISIRHALPDPGSLMAWARSECFAFVLYYKQRTRENAKDRVAVWTRELIEAAIRAGGSYYLPYQPHGTVEQFHRAYPRANELFALKQRLDPGYRLRNTLWDKYYAPTLAPAAPVEAPPQASDFHIVYSDCALQDGFYRFLQNVYRLYPEDRFHTLIRKACERYADDESIYRCLQQELPGIKPRLADLTYALPSLAKQKREMTRQATALVGDRRDFDGYVEIGTTGRYVCGLRSALRLRGPLTLISETPVGNSPVDIVERGQLGKPGAVALLNNYEPIAESIVPSNSVDLVSCFIGLHHIPLDRLQPFMGSIWRMLRPGGVFILRDHDVCTPGMRALVSLAHTVFNAGLGVPWETNRQELRFFTSVDEWVKRLERTGFRDSGQRLLQAHDPSLNVLMAFTKVERPAEAGAA